MMRETVRRGYPLDGYTEVKEPGDLRKIFPVVWGMRPDTVIDVNVHGGHTEERFPPVAGTIVVPNRHLVLAEIAVHTSVHLLLTELQNKAQESVPTSVIDQESDLLQMHRDSLLNAILFSLDQTSRRHIPTTLAISFSRLWYQSGREKHREPEQWWQGDMAQVALYPQQPLPGGSMRPLGQEVLMYKVPVGETI